MKFGLLQILVAEHPNTQFCDYLLDCLTGYWVSDIFRPDEKTVCYFYNTI